MLASRRPVTSFLSKTQDRSGIELINFQHEIVDIKQCDPIDQLSANVSELERARLNSVRNARGKSVRLMVAPQCKVELKKPSFHRIRNLIGKVKKNHESVKQFHESDNLVSATVGNPMFQTQQNSQIKEEIVYKLFEDQSCALTEEEWEEVFAGNADLVNDF